MLEPDLHAALERLAQAVRSRAITQKDIADATGVHQSQVSRILAGQIRRVSANVLALCKYADLHFVDVGAIRPNKRSEIADALAEVLSGHPKEVTAATKVLASLVAWRRTWRQSR